MLDKNVKAYLSAIDAAAIYVLVDDGKPVLIGVAKNLDVVARKLATRKFGWIAWAKSETELLEISRFKKIDILLKKNLQECVEGIWQIAESRKVVLSKHETVIQRARLLSSKIDRRFLELKNNGSLRHFNKAYQRYRFEQEKNGRPVLPYFGVMARLRRIVVRSLIDGKEISAFMELLHHEFPWLSTVADKASIR